MGVRIEYKNERRGRYEKYLYQMLKKEYQNKKNTTGRNETYFQKKKYL